MFIVALVFAAEILDDYLRRHDPVRKAERFLAKKPKTERLCALRVRPGSKRTSFPARTNHQVHARDRGRCTHTNENGDRCENDRWIEPAKTIPFLSLYTSYAALILCIGSGVA